VHVTATYQLEKYTMTVIVASLHPRLTADNFTDYLGPVPMWLDEDNSESAAKQFNANYQHGGGWRPFGEGQWKLDKDTHELTYPGDPTLKPIAAISFRDEVIYAYEHAIFCIIQPDGKFEVARMD
jgi:hypothetical protein